MEARRGWRDQKIIFFDPRKIAFSHSQGQNRRIRAGRIVGACPLYPGSGLHVGLVDPIGNQRDSTGLWSRNRRRWGLDRPDRRVRARSRGDIATLKPVALPLGVAGSQLRLRGVLAW